MTTDHDQAAVLGRIANLEKETIELAELRDSLVQQAFLRAQMKHFDSTDPRPRSRLKDDGVPWLWILAGVMMFITYGIASRVAMESSQETARQL